MSFCITWERTWERRGRERGREGALIVGHKGEVIKVGDPGEPMEQVMKCYSS